MSLLWDMGQHGGEQLMKRYPALAISALLAVAAAVVSGVLSVPEPWQTIALVVLIAASGAGIHTQVTPAKVRRGKVR